MLEALEHHFLDLLDRLLRHAARHRGHTSSRHCSLHAQEAAILPIKLVWFVSKPCRVKIENDSNFKRRGERAEGEGLHLVGMAGNGQGSIDTQLERYIDAGVHQAKAKFCSIGPYMTSKSSKFCKDPAGDGQKRTGGGG